MRILVTGATGFIGGAFTRRALAAGHAVGALVRRPAPGPPAMTQMVGTLAAAPWKEIDRFAPDVCVHAAWTTEAGVYRESAENFDYRDESLVFAETLLKRGLTHLVALGTSAEYAASAQPLHEERSALGPISPYATAKHELRLALGERARSAGACLGWARVFQPYGYGEPAARMCSTVARRVAAGERVTLDAPGAIRDWIHVDDVAAALLTMVERRADAVVNVGSSVGHTVHDVALAIAKILGRPELIDAPAGRDASGSCFVADVGRLRALGWEPRVDLGAGLTGLVASLG
jgi:nucleoside-diphosphate-sugar epimerase